MHLGLVLVLSGWVYVTTSEKDTYDSLVPGFYHFCLSCLEYKFY